MWQELVKVTLFFYTSPLYIFQTDLKADFRVKKGAAAMIYCDSPFYL